MAERCIEFSVRLVFGNLWIKIYYENHSIFYGINTITIFCVEFLHIKTWEENQNTLRSLMWIAEHRQKTVRIYGISFLVLPASSLRFNWFWIKMEFSMRAFFSSYSKIICFENPKTSECQTILMNCRLVQSNAALFKVQLNRLNWLTCTKLAEFFFWVKQYIASKVRWNGENAALHRTYHSIFRSCAIKLQRHFFLRDFCESVKKCLLISEKPPSFFIRLMLLRRLLSSFVSVFPVHFATFFSRFLMRSYFFRLLLFHIFSRSLARWLIFGLSLTSF